MSAKLSWVYSIHPDICTTVALLSQITENNLTSTTFDPGNSIAEHLKNTPNLVIHFPKMDHDNLYVVVDPMPPKAWNLDEDRFQTGFIIILLDHTNQ